MSTMPPIQKDTDSFSDPRWKGVVRPYTEDQVRKLRGSIRIEHTLADKGARRLWKSMHEKPFVRSLGALTGGQAVQMVRAGLEAIYCSGWQVAADANTSAGAPSTICSRSAEELAKESRTRTSPWSDSNAAATSPRASVSDEAASTVISSSPPPPAQAVATTATTPASRILGPGIGGTLRSGPVTKVPPHAVVRP